MPQVGIAVERQSRDENIHVDLVGPGHLHLVPPAIGPAYQHDRQHREYDGEDS